MCLLRTPWKARLVAGLLALSLLPAAWTPFAAAPQQGSTSACAGWLRARMPAPQDAAARAALDAALRAACAADVATLKDFAAAFVEAHPDPERLARSLGASALSSEVLLQYLSRRSLRPVPLTGTQPSLTAAVPAGFVFGQLSLHTIRTAGHLAAGALPAGSLQIEVGASRFALALRALFAAQPLGP